MSSVEATVFTLPQPMSEVSLGMYLCTPPTRLADILDTCSMISERTLHVSIPQASSLRMEWSSQLKRLVDFALLWH
jgi:hypothetical protein